MSTREDLKALIDQLPEEKLDLAGLSLDSILNPPVPNPRIEQFKQRSEEFQKQLPERLKQLQAGGDPGAVRGFAMVWGVPGDWVRNHGKRTVNTATPGKKSVRA